MTFRKVLLAIFCASVTNIVFAMKQESIVSFDGFNGVKTYRYASASLSAIEEWQSSGIANDLIDLNLISLPYFVKQEGLHYPFLDLMDLRYEEIPKRVLPIEKELNQSIWTYTGYRVKDLSLITDHEIKVDPKFRTYGKYEHTNKNPQIILPKVSLKIAKQFFPKQYSIKSSQRFEAKGFWNEVFASDLPIVLTEGHKKALSLLSHGYLGISVHQRFLGTEVKTINGDLELQITDDLKELVLKKPRKFYLVFDYDKSESVREIVYSTALFVATEIEKLGSKVRIILLPKTNAKGVDDYLYQYGEESFENLYNNSISLKELQKIQGQSLQNHFNKFKMNRNYLNWCFEPVTGNEWLHIIY